MAVQLTCGEGGSTGSEILGQVNQNSTDVETLQGQVTDMESRHVLLLNCESTAVSQEPVAVDTPIQVEFGGAQSVTDVSIAADGALTFNTAGKYKVNINAHYGRSGATGTSILLFRLLLNAVQIGATLSAKIDNTNTLVPWSNTFNIQVTAGQVLTSQLMRDSAGSDSGGLFKVSPTLAGWNDAPSISMQIYREG